MENGGLRDNQRRAVTAVLSEPSIKAAQERDAGSGRIVEEIGTAGCRGRRRPRR
jgi:hypothetical protein